MNRNVAGAASAGALIAAIAVGTIVISSGTGASQPGRKFAASEKSTRPGSAPTDSADLLQSMVKKIDDSSIISVQVGAPRLDAGPGPTIDAVVKADGPGDETYWEAEWELDVIAGDLAESLSAPKADLRDAFSGMRLTLVKPDGTRLTGFRSLGDLQSGQVFSQAASEQVRAETARIVEDHGYALDSVKVFRLRDNAVSLRVSVPNITSVGKIAEVSRQLAGTPLRYEALDVVYLVGDSVVARTSGNSRLGTASWYGRPDVRGDLGFIHG